MPLSCRDIAEAEMRSRRHLDPATNLRDGDREEAARNIPYMYCLKLARKRHAEQRKTGVVSTH
jgi:hypothetical protein